MCNARKRCASQIAVAATIVFIMVYPIAASATFLAVEWSPMSSEIYSFEEDSGAVSPIVFSDRPGLNSLTVGPSGRFLTATDRLVEIDPITGSTYDDIFLDFGDDPTSVRALAYSSMHGLFAINVGADQFTALFSIDPISGVASQRGGELFFVQALAFSPEDILYGWSRNIGLFIMDPQTGQVTDVSSGGAGPFMQSIAFAPDGRLFGALSGWFYELNPESGAVLQSFRNTKDTRGMAFVPEPGTALLLGFGLAGLASRPRPVRLARAT